MSLENVIAKYLLNKTDKQELEQLKEWQSEASDNLQALEDMQKIFALDMKDYKSYNKSTAWDNITSKMDESDSTGSAKVIQLKQWMMSAVAIMAFVAATTFAWKTYMTESTPLQYVTTQSQQTAELIDQSVVTLDRNSTLDILSENFASDRALSLQGRAYFDVAKDLDHPFTVKLTAGKIKVLGTEFSLSTLDGIEEVYVTEGKVEYTIGERSFVLVAGDYIKVIDGDVVKLDMPNTNYLSWKSGKLVLDNVPISKALDKISNHFQKEIVLKNPAQSMDCDITTTLEYESLEDALEELKILIALEYSTQGNKIVVTSTKC